MDQVIYLHDGQNLFDPATSYAGDWNLLPVVSDLSAAGREVMLVGVANTGAFRRFEYSPWRDPVHGGGDGDRYLDFMLETIKPLVDRSFPTPTEPEHTLVAGSSLGGLVTIYALLRNSGVFGGAAAFSPSAWFAGEVLAEFVAGRPAGPGRLYLDVGTGEEPGLVASVRRLRDALEGAGWASPAFRYHEAPEDTHHETHWGRRFRAWVLDG